MYPFHDYENDEAEKSSQIDYDDDVIDR